MPFRRWSSAELLQSFKWLMGVARKMTSALQLKHIKNTHSKRKKKSGKWLRSKFYKSIEWWWDTAVGLVAMAAQVSEISVITTNKESRKAAHLTIQALRLRSTLRKWIKLSFKQKNQRKVSLPFHNHRSKKTVRYQKTSFTVSRICLLSVNLSTGLVFSKSKGLISTPFKSSKWMTSCRWAFRSVRRKF